MIRDIIILIRAELSKIRSTFIPWFFLIATAIMPLIIFLVFLFTGDKNPFLGQNPWDLYLKTGFLGISSFLFPMFVILLVALIVNLENKNNTWKKMYVLPFSRDLLYIGKFSFVLSMVVLAILFFMVLPIPTSSAIRRRIGSSFKAIIRGTS